MSVHLKHGLTKEPYSLLSFNIKVKVATVPKTCFIMNVSC